MNIYKIIRDAPNNFKIPLYTVTPYIHFKNLQYFGNRLLRKEKKDNVVNLTKDKVYVFRF